MEVLLIFAFKGYSTYPLLNKDMLFLHIVSKINVTGPLFQLFINLVKWRTNREENRYTLPDVLPLAQGSCCQPGLSSLLSILHLEIKNALGGHVQGHDTTSSCHMAVKPFSSAQQKRLLWTMHLGNCWFRCQMEPAPVKFGFMLFVNNKCLIIVLYQYLMPKEHIC